MKGHSGLKAVLWWGRALAAACPLYTVLEALPSLVPV